MSKSPRRPERFEVVVSGEPVGVEVGVDGRVDVDGEAIGSVENTGRCLPRTSRWRARNSAGEPTASGYTAKEAATALVYVVLRDPERRARLERAPEKVARLPKPENPPEDVCPICRTARDRCDCRPDDYGLDDEVGFG